MLSKKFLLNSGDDYELIIISPKKNIPNDLLFELLDKICLKTDKYYLIDYNSLLEN